MKKLVLVLMALLALCACNRMRVKHDHSKQVQSVRIPVDTAQKDYVNDVKDESWKDEDLVVLPEEPEHGKSSSSSNIDEEIERMMRGEDLSGQ